MSAWTTKRTSGLLMPMPKAMVATITTPSSPRKASWWALRTGWARPPGFGRPRGAPLRGAVRVGEREPFHVGRLEAGGEGGVGEPFRRDIEEAKPALIEKAPGVVGLALVVRRVQRRGGNAEEAHLLHLVAHQGD